MKIEIIDKWGLASSAMSVFGAGHFLGISVCGEDVRWLFLAVVLLVASVFTFFCSSKLTEKEPGIIDANQG